MLFVLLIKCDMGHYWQQLGCNLSWLTLLNKKIWQFKRSCFFHDKVSTCLLGSCFWSKTSKRWGNISLSKYSWPLLSLRALLCLTDVYFPVLQCTRLAIKSKVFDLFYIIRSFLIKSSCPLSPVRTEHILHCMIGSLTLNTCYNMNQTCTSYSFSASLSLV